MTELLKLYLTLRILKSSLTSSSGGVIIRRVLGRGTKYMDEIVTPVIERRHGDTMYLPIGISVRDLRERIEERLLQ